MVNFDLLTGTSGDGDILTTEMEVLIKISVQSTPMCKNLGHHAMFVDNFSILGRDAPRYL